MAKTVRVDTTLGDLIVALTNASAQYTENENEANILVAYLLSDLLERSQESAVTWH
jgi:hypothetical protein